MGDMDMKKTVLNIEHKRNAHFIIVANTEEL